MYYYCGSIMRGKKINMISINPNKIIFKGFDWNYFTVQLFGNRVAGVPFTAGVYFIVVKSNKSRIKRLVYIGCTRSLYCRIISHVVINKLKRNVNNYTIQVLFRCFGSTLQENRVIERALIKKYKPCFNGHYEIHKKLTEADFWTLMGVYKLRKKFGHKPTIEIK